MSGDDAWFTGQVFRSVVPPVEHSRPDLPPVVNLAIAPMCGWPCGRHWQTPTMTSWRDSTPENVQALFDGLCGLAVDTAVDMLTKRKEFYPFGFEAHGEEAVMIGADPGLGERPPSQGILDLLYEGTRGRRDEVDAVAYVCDVRLESGSDAVRVDLEHRAGYSLEIVTPYRLKRFGRGVETGQMAVSSGACRIWP